MTMKRVAVVGATGAVGREMMAQLAQREFPLAELRPMASSRSAGIRLRFRDELLEVEEATERSFAGLDIVLMSAGAGTARTLGPAAAASGAVVEPLIPHEEFLRATQAAPWVITDGGSIQEECAVLGVPTLLWRARTERSDGLDANVVISDYDPAVVARFLDEPERFRRPPMERGRSPAAVVADHLVSINS